MSRAANRIIKKTFQNHFLPTFLKDLGTVKDPRNESYIAYDIEEILYSVIMKNVCSISSTQTGRKRWKIENEGFNIQKNHRYDIEHANCLDYNAMKNHYLLTQISDILLQLYENGIKGLREIKRTIKNISSDLLTSFGRQLTREDISYTEKRTSLSIS